VLISSRDSRWGFVPDHSHLKLAPKGEARVQVRALRSSAGFDDGLRLPEVALELGILGQGGRLSLPARSRELPLDLTQLAVPSAPAEDRCLALLDPGDHLRLEHEQVALPDGPLTLECRLKARSFGERVGLVCKTENSEFGIFVNGGVPEFIVHLDGAYRTAKADTPVLSVGTWHHLAGVYDGGEVRLYLDGELLAKAPASGKRTLRNLPLIVGADVDGRGVATSPFDGWIDEVRLSTSARYGGERFEPPIRHGSDAQTHVLLHLDHKLGPWVYDASPRRMHPRRVGRPRLVALEQ
jgi:concanavalin A-like lectin/glucanase superfamily protein